MNWLILALALTIPIAPKFHKKPKATKGGDYALTSVSMLAGLPKIHTIMWTHGLGNDTNYVWDTLLFSHSVNHQKWMVYCITNGNSCVLSVTNKQDFFHMGISTNRHDNTYSVMPL